MKPRRTCPKCGRTLVRNGKNFVRTRNKTTGQWTYKHCRTCERKRQAVIRAAIRNDPERRARYNATDAARLRRRRADNPERFRAWQRAYRERLKADPERYAELVLVPLRFRQEGERKRRALDAYKAPCWQNDAVDADAFRAFLLATFPGWTAGELAELVGHAVSERRLREIITTRQVTVELPTVDAFLTHGLGRPDLLNVLYPWGAAA